MRWPDFSAVSFVWWIFGVGLYEGHSWIRVNLHCPLLLLRLFQHGTEQISLIQQCMQLFFVSASPRVDDMTVAASEVDVLWPQSHCCKYLPDT